MKRLINSLLLALVSFCANAEEMPSVAEVYEIYHYCLYEIETDDDSSNVEAELLTCVNQELSEGEYPTFASFNALMDYIRSYFEGEESSVENTLV